VFLDLASQVGFSDAPKSSSHKHRDRVLNVDFSSISWFQITLDYDHRRNNNYHDDEIWSGVARISWGRLQLNILAPATDLTQSSATPGSVTYQPLSVPLCPL
jgi:hypothetical protein